MALRRDGSSKRSASYMPYDSSNSFVRKIANKVTGLVGWRSQSPSSVISQNYDNLSNSTDEDTVSPTPKRIRMQSDEDDALFKLIPCANRGTSELCSPIQPINNINAASTSNRNQCFVASTPADALSSISVPCTSKQTPDSNVTDSFDNNESVNTSLTIPQFNVHQRHHVTVPTLSRDASSQVSNLDSERRTGASSVTNARKPSFNIDAFSNSSRRLSMSVCENRNVNSLSPFYSARTLYGGASALLPYGSPSMSRLRSASSSKMNLFAPRSQITIQPVSPSPNNCNSDQETMSTSARRILDTLERFCSPVMDAKRIPVNELRKVGGNATTTPERSVSKGTKRKLPSLNQMTPSTTDLLRIKRQEKMQDSISSARQMISSVADNTIAAEDSDASSDSTDLDYSILTSDTNAKLSQKYIGKTRRKDEKKFDHSPLPALKLPNAVLKITNLPKFDITDTFTFSKPLLLENFEQNTVEESNEPVVSAAVSKSLTPSISLAVSSATKLTPSSPSTATTPSLEKVSNVMSMQTSPQFVTKVAASQSGKTVDPKPLSPKVTTTPWTCKVCLLESTDERCSSCTCMRTENNKPTTVPKPQPPVSQPDVVSSAPQLSGWGDKFKPATDKWECKECFVRNAITTNKCVACESPKPGAQSSAAVAPVSSSNELWPSMPKPAGTSAWTFGVPAKDTTDSIEKPKEALKSPAITFGFGKPADFGSTSDSTFKTDADKKSLANDMPASVAVSKPSFLFGVNNATNTALTLNLSSDNATKNNVPPAVPFGDTNAKNASAVTFSFGVNKSSDATDPGTCNAIGMKNPLTESSSAKSEAGKSNELKRNASVFNDVSSITNNTKNPLLKSPAEATTSNDASTFKMPKTIPPFATASANKENGDDKSTGSNLFGAAGSTTSTESPSKKKSILFPSVGSSSVASSVFGNGFAKPDASAALTNSNATPAVGNSTSNVFPSSFTSAKPMNDLAQPQLASPFGGAPLKSESITSNDSSKSNKLFPSTNSFGAGVSAPQQQQQQVSKSSSVFGGFGGSSLEPRTTMNTTFNTTPFNFGGGSSAAAPPATVSQQTSSGGFSFNGSKAGETKFVFGSTSMTSSAPNATNSTLGGAFNPPQFNNPTNTLAGSGSAQFNFNSPMTNDQVKPMNSIFAATTPSLPNNNSVPTFGNTLFGNASQQPSQTMNPTKKPGGFNFPAPTQFAAQPSNNFGGFGNATAKSQDQSILNSNATSGTPPYVFGLANVPSSFNFSGGNAVPTFSAQPTAINNMPSSGLPQRKIKKAVRRTAK